MNGDDSGTATVGRLVAHKAVSMNLSTAFGLASTRGHRCAARQVWVRLRRSRNDIDRETVQ